MLAAVTWFAVGAHRPLIRMTRHSYDRGCAIHTWSASQWHGGSFSQDAGMWGNDSVPRGRIFMAILVHLDMGE